MTRLHTKSRTVNRPQADQVSRTILMAMLESLDEGIIALSPSGETFANQLFIEMFGSDPSGRKPALFTLAEALKKYAIIDESGNEVPPDMRPMPRVLRGEVIPDTYVEVRFPHGKTIDAVYRGRPVLNEDGSIAYAIIAARDVTQQRRMAAELSELKKRSVQLEKTTALESLTLAVAHELNQPLATAMSHLASMQMMLPEESDDQIPARIRASIENILRASKIIKSFRERLRTSRLEVRPHLSSKLISDAVAVLDSQRLLNGLEVVIAPDAQDVLVDDILIQQVLVNLLKNALEATQQQQVARFAITADRINPDYVRVCVQDDGPGLCASMAERLFEPFNSGGSAKKDNLGVGLAICKSIIDQHQGKIWLGQSEAGACFYFTVPSLPTHSHLETTGGESDRE